MESPPGDKKSNQDTLSEKAVHQESSKAANAAIAAKKKSKALEDAAAAAGDPDERQKLMQQAMDAQIEAGSYGKTAKYMRSGTFQGMAVGTGVGIAPSATLGALTGTLVGGVTSIVTGGLGAGIGAAAGAAHGPLVDMGEWAGKGVRSITGSLPGWAASDEQKATLEKMITQIDEEDMPDSKELENIGKESDGGQLDVEWVQGVRSKMPSIPGLGGGGGGGGGEGGGESASRQGDEAASESQPSGKEALSIESKPQNKGISSSPPQKKKPRKLQADLNHGAKVGMVDRSTQTSPCHSQSRNLKKQPRKLEVRSSG